MFYTITNKKGLKTKTKTKKLRAVICMQEEGEEGEEDEEEQMEDEEETDYNNNYFDEGDDFAEADDGDEGATF